MHTHRIDSFLITENVRIEIVHESNPYFAGEPVSLVVRLRHLGSQNELSILNETISNIREEIESETNRRDPEDEHDGGNGEDKPWLMKSLLRAFSVDKSDDGSTASNLERKNKAIETLNRQLQFHKPVELISGYLQISGVFQFDPEFISEFKLDKTSVKIGGMDAFINHDIDSSMDTAGSGRNDLSKFLNSKHTSSLSDRPSLQGEGGSSFLLGNMDESIEYKKSPVLLIPQTLLFTELTLEAGVTKIFKFKTENLPINLPPTYNISRNMALNYTLEFGVSKLQVADVKKYRVHMPISVAPYVSATGAQYTCKLNQKVKIMESGVVKELKQKPSNQKRLSSSFIGTPRRMSSFMINQERNDTAEKLKRNFVQLIKSNQNGDKDIEELVDLQMKMQFEDSDDEISSNDTNDLPQGSENPYLSHRPNVVANNISNLKSTNLISHLNNIDSSEDSENGLVPQISNLQNVYQINWNGQSITKLILSSAFYTTSDDINLVLELDPSSPPLHKLSAVTVSFEAFELVSRNFATDTTRTSKPKGNQIYESRSICFDKCQSIPMKLITPKTPMGQLPSQFKTDIFQFKWMLVLKFVLVPRVENINLEQFYEDKKGVLFHAKETLEGEEFSCHIPIPLLPSSRNFGGW